MIESMKRASLVLLLLLGATAAAAAEPREYRLDLELDPTATFPFLARFGKIEISLYPGGVSASAPLLRGFSTSGSDSVTIMSPISRLYADLPIDRIRPLLLGLAGADEAEIAATRKAYAVSAPVRGKVKGLEALRYRIRLGKKASVDIWTTKAIPHNEQYSRIALECVAALSKPAARTAMAIDGMPVYIELNTKDHQKVALLRVKSFTPSSAGEREALRTGSLYVKAPVIERVLGR